jgi:hypothetical protein
MGRKPAERAVVTVAPRHGLEFEAAVPCPACGVPSRRSQKRFRVCGNGHKFTKKSDQ